MYNTRRGGSYGSPANNVGQRRPQPQGNTPGGQLRPNFNKNNQQQPPKTPQQQQQPIPKTPQQPPKTPQQQPPKTPQQQQPPKTPQQTPKTAQPVVNALQTPQKTSQAVPKPVVATPKVAPAAVATPASPQTPIKPAEESILQKSAEALINQNKAAQEEDTKMEPVTEAAMEVGADEKSELEDSMDVSTTEENGVAAGGPRSIKWAKRGKISRAEKIRRRNRILKKVIQPKNALMVLNEIVGNTAFDLVEMPPNINAYAHGGTVPSNFKATVTVDGKVHEGYGKNKPAAKTAAAESALKHLVVTRMTADQVHALPVTPPAPTVSTGTEDEKPDIEKVEAETDSKMEEDDVSICHLASFALYKLFSSWEDTTKILSRTSSCTSLNTTTNTNMVADPSRANTVNVKTEMKPSKKLPENPELMNPVMLLNQMFPNAMYEEVCKTGTPPKLVFTMKCSIDDKAFIGNGSNKKVARREAAFIACKELLCIEYPEEQVPQ